MKALKLQHKTWYDFLREKEAIYLYPFSQCFIVFSPWNIFGSLKDYELGQYWVLPNNQ